MTAVLETAATPKIRKVVRKHHLLVRISHWLNIPLLLGLTLSGVSIYWAAPVYHHAAGASGNTDYLADIGTWVVKRHILAHGYALPAADGSVPAGMSSAGDWFYNHFGLGTGLLAEALKLHWFFAYAFMANGLLYALGLLLGGGYRALLPRRTDPAGAFAMIRYYLGLLPARLSKRSWPHPHVASKYNALQRGAYFTMPLVGLLAIATGWAIHKPQQLGWLQALFGGYDWARVWHFWIPWLFLAFIIPHVILVAADGWDTFRSMIVGWSERVKDAETE
jgi:thiosulfate reductase cytochrome b subunit